MRADRFDEMLEGELRAQANGEPRAGWQGRVMAGVAGEAGQAGRVWGWGLLAAVAAVLLLVVGLTAWWRGGVDGPQRTKDQAAVRDGGAADEVRSGTATARTGRGVDDRARSGAGPEEVASRRERRGREGTLPARGQEVAASEVGGTAVRQGGEGGPVLATFPALRHEEGGGGWFGGSSETAEKVLPPETGRALVELRARQSETLAIPPVQIAALSRGSEMGRGVGRERESLNGTGGK